MISWGFWLKYYRKLIEGIWRGPYTRMEDNSQILINLKKYTMEELSQSH